jgi:hypothetical protein
MNRLLFVCAVCVGLCLSWMGPSESACQWTWECRYGVGSCRQVPVCDRSFDVVPPRPPSVAPIPLPSVRPVPMPMVPPVGTTHCAPQYLCSFGRCAWQTLCQ